MPSKPMNGPFPTDEALEQLIREAGDYVVPTPDLRPRVLEAAKQMYVEHRLTRRVGFLALATLALWMLIQPLTSLMDIAYAKWRGPDADAIDLLAKKIVDETGCDTNWALVEAMRTMRELPADASRQRVAR